MSEKGTAHDELKIDEAVPKPISLARGSSSPEKPSL
jgi:hypothetical protein